jgi:hypothetical protein
MSKITKITKITKIKEKQSRNESVIEIGNKNNNKTKYFAYFIPANKPTVMNNIANLLQHYSVHTFDCPILYYNKHKNLLAFIVLKEHINWSNYAINFSHNVKNKLWNESSSISIDGITIGEFQVHNKRDCIKFRWCFEKLLTLFEEHFTISNL